MGMDEVVNLTCIREYIALVFQRLLWAIKKFDFFSERILQRIGPRVITPLTHTHGLTNSFLFSTVANDSKTETFRFKRRFYLQSV